MMAISRKPRFIGLARTAHARRQMHEVLHSSPSPAGRQWLPLQKQHDFLFLSSIEITVSSCIGTGPSPPRNGRFAAAHARCSLSVQVRAAVLTRNPAAAPIKRLRATTIRRALTDVAGRFERSMLQKWLIERKR